MIGTFGLCISDRAANAVRAKHHIGVGEQEPVSVRLVCRGPHGVRLAHPAWGKFRDVDDSEMFMRVRCDAIHNFAGAVGGAVVDSDYLIVAVVESKQAVQSLLN